MSSIIHVRSGDAYLLSGANDRRLVISVTKAGVAVDLTGVVATFMVKASRHDTDVLAKITKTPVIPEQTGTALGKAYIALTSADTASLEGRYLWELSATDAVGVITLAAGVFHVTADLIVGT